MKEALIEKTTEAFRQKFQSPPERLFLSPGRINIIGEHVDYNDGFVLPAAIDKYLCFAISPAESGKCEFFAVDLDDAHSLSLDEAIKPISKQWVNYLLGVLFEIQKRGKKFGGFSVAFSSNIPMGAGLSSSAALECGFAFALNRIFGLGISKQDIALIGQKSEHTFAGVNCGIMDQFASVFGEQDKVIMLDCNSLEYEYFDADLGDNCLVLFDSCVKHTLLLSAYNGRRKEVEEGFRIIASHFPEVKTFRDCTQKHVEFVKNELGEIRFRRCRFVIEEIHRVSEAAKALAIQDFGKLGTLLQQTHTGLSEDYEVSCDELDFLVKQTLSLEGVYGARMMGGGFGGCTLNLIKKEKATFIAETIKAEYHNRFGIEMKVYPVTISRGTHEYPEYES